MRMGDYTTYSSLKHYVRLMAMMDDEVFISNVDGIHLSAHRPTLSES